MKKVLFAITSGLLPLCSLAHEGHGDTDGYTIIHYFVEAPHAFFTWSGVTLGAVLVYRRYIRKRKPAAGKIQDHA